MKNNEIMLNSEFQRRFDASDKDNWIVIDGLQRLNAIKRFVLEKTLRLEGLTIMKNFKDYEAMTCSHKK